MPLPTEDLRQAAVSMLDARRAMRGSLPANLIHDVALEMLLGLYLQHPIAMTEDDLASDQTVSIASARRWIEALCAEGLVFRGDGLAKLTVDGEQAMAAMLSAVIASQRRLHGWPVN